MQRGRNGGFEVTTVSLLQLCILGKLVVVMIKRMTRHDVNYLFTLYRDVS